ncbi:MAG: SOS response-associated peptidase [Bacteroidetes bacterium]|nr:MAG: SOS response-associated peptidase [Bacteroidota bacterium]
MCGRYSLVTTVAQIEQQLQVHFEQVTDLPANYNVAPTQLAWCVTNTDPQLLQAFHWGLVPHWAKDKSRAASLINARRESISTKPSFRIPIRRRRCLVLADSFYEWRRSGKQKLPYRILRDNAQLLVFAGLWDEWHSAQGIYRSFTIITTEPNREMAAIHNRMPALLLTKAQQRSWLADQPLEDALELLNTPPDNVLQMYRVSSAINSVRYNEPAAHIRVQDDPLTLF